MQSLDGFTAPPDVPVLNVTRDTARERSLLDHRAGRQSR